MNAHEIIRLYQDGLISKREAVDSLEGLQVRGGFDSENGFTGYDYANQRWITA